MDSQYIEKCKYSLSVGCLQLQYHIDRTIADQTHDEKAVRYADRLLERTPREIIPWTEFQKYLDHYCFAVLIGNFEWARESVRGIETLASVPTECSYLF